MGHSRQTAAEDPSAVQNAASICLIGWQACVMSRNRLCKTFATALQLKHTAHSKQTGGGIAQLQRNVEGRAQQLCKKTSIIYIGRV